MQQKQTLHSLKLLIFLFHATNTIIISFLPLYLKNKGLSGTEIGWVLAIGPFASIISQPFWGILSDKYKTVKRMLILSVFGMLIASIIFFQMNHLLAILIFGAIFYFFSSPVGALSDSLAQRRANELNISFGSIRTWGSVGFAFSSLIVGEILSKIGVEYIIFPYISFGVILLLVAFFIRDVQTDASPVKFNDIGLLLKNKPYVTFLIFMLFIAISHRANDSYIGLYIAELGGAENLVGIAWFVGLVSEATVFALSAIWFRKFHPITFAIFAGILYSVRWFIYGSVDQPSTIILFQILHGVTFGVFYVATFDFISRIIPQKLQATGHLIFYSVLFGVSGIIGSLGGGVILENYGGGVLYFSMGVLAIIGSALLIGYLIVILKGQKNSVPYGD